MVKGGFRMTAPEFTPIVIQELMTRCWYVESWKRPSFQRIKRKFQPKNPKIMWHEHNLDGGIYDGTRITF